MPRTDGLSSPGKFYIENLGCAKNQVDAETMIAVMQEAGWTYVESNPEEAQLIIVNTCGFIRTAQEESVNTLLGVKKEYPDAKVLAAGCLSQRWAGELAELIPELDGVFGNRAPRRVTETTADVMEGRRPVFVPEADSPEVEQRTAVRRQKFFGFNRSVYVKISEGCNHRCGFCAIPLIKGGLKSRTPEAVLSEVTDLLGKGVYEFNFVAQDLASFGTDAGEEPVEGLVKLLRMILDSAGSSSNFRIRLLYLHPDVFSERLLDLMASDGRVLPYLDLPFQHISPPVLREMGRSGNMDKYLSIVDAIRTRLPDSVIRSTFLVGHPGEGRKEFRELMDFQEKAQLDWLGVFPWSREEGTRAAERKSELAARLGSSTALRRKKILEERQMEISSNRLKRWIGKELEVLAEEPVEGENLTLGRGFMNAPEVDGSIVLHAPGIHEGDVVTAKITGLSGLDLQASPIHKDNRIQELQSRRNAFGNHQKSQITQISQKERKAQ